MPLVILMMVFVIVTRALRGMAAVAVIWMNAQQALMIATKQLFVPTSQTVKAFYVNVKQVIGS